MDEADEDLAVDEADKDQAVDEDLGRSNSITSIPVTYPPTFRSENKNWELQASLGILNNTFIQCIAIITNSLILH